MIMREGEKRQKRNEKTLCTSSAIGFPGGSFGREDGRGGGGGGTGLPRDCGVAGRAGDEGPVTHQCVRLEHSESDFLSTSSLQTRGGTRTRFELKNQS